MSTKPAFAGPVPANYDRYLGPLVFIPYAKDIAARIPSNAKSILELACGTGLVTAEIIKKFSGIAKITATDLNPDMLAVAKDLVRSKEIDWQIVDMSQLPFADNSFDTVVCQFGLMFVPDKAKAFSEAYRVLKKGGTFLFNTWDKIQDVGAFDIGNQVIVDFFKDNPPTFYKIPFSLHDPSELERYMNDAGFFSIRVENVKKEGSSATAMDAAKGIVEGSPILKEIVERDASAINILKNKIEQRLQEKYGRGELRHEIHAYVGQGTK
jgi:ubiquinone/menaquinone biosynthesis C-methylase UbiE